MSGTALTSREAREVGGGGLSLFTLYHKVTIFVTRMSLHKCKNIKYVIKNEKHKAGEVRLGQLPLPWLPVLSPISFCGLGWLLLLPSPPTNQAPTGHLK